MHVTLLFIKVQQENSLTKLGNFPVWSVKRHLQAKIQQMAGFFKGKITESQSVMQERYDSIANSWVI